MHCLGASGPCVCPHPDDEPTKEHLSGLHHVVSVGSVLYCDFAVFGPNENRLSRKLASNGLVFVEDG